MRRFGLPALGPALLLCWSLAASAAIDVFDFDSDAQRARYQHFIEDMRCPKCQNQNLAGSDAPIAADLRRELHRLLLAGQNDAQIQAYMVSRYGDFILYDPPLDKTTVWLWSAPAVFLAIGFIALVRVQRRRQGEAAPAPLDAAERARLTQLLGATGIDKEGGPS